MKDLRAAIRPRDVPEPAIDPVWHKCSERIRREHGRAYGRAIVSLGRAHGLIQSEVAGFSERQLRRIEQTGAVSVGALEKLAKSHRMSLARYLDEVARHLSLR